MEGTYLHLPVPRGICTFCMIDNNEMLLGADRLHGSLCSAASCASHPLTVPPGETGIPKSFSITGEACALTESLELLRLQKS